MEWVVATRLVREGSTSERVHFRAETLWMGQWDPHSRMEGE